MVRNEGSAHGVAIGATVRLVALIAAALAAFVMIAAAQTGSADAAKAPKCFGKRATIVGTAHADTIRGTKRADVIVSRGGADRIRSRGGRDRICSGSGADRLDGGASIDLLDGGGGRSDRCLRAEQARRCELPADEPDVEFDHPAEGEVVDGAVQLSAADLNGASGALVNEVSFAFSPDGVNFSPLGSKSSGEPSVVVWNTTDLPAGEYTVRVDAELANGETTTDTRALVVNKAPVAVATFSCDGSTVSLDSIGSFDPDLGDTIVNYTWDFGDGSPLLSGPSASGALHVYPETGEFYPELQVEDDRGAVGIVHVGFNVSDCQARVKTCDPISMDVKSSGDSAWDMYWLKDSANSKQLGYTSSLDEDSWAAAADTDTFYIRFNFEVDTTLVANSDPALCAEGQNVRRTSTFGDEVIKKNGAKAGASPSAAALAEEIDCGFDAVAADAWCDDNYHGTSAHSIVKLEDAKRGWIKVHVAQNRIIWRDGPGTPEIRKRLLARLGAKGFTYQGKFKAEVKGVTKTVSCSWQVEIKVKVLAGVPSSTGAGLTDKVCA